MIFLLFATVVLSVQPTVTIQSSSGSIQIVYPKNEYFLMNTNSKLHFHVHNTTNWLLTNLTTKCNFHLYNYTGNHVFEGYLPFDSNGMDFYFDLNTTYTNKAGEYPYLVYCNTSKEAGFLSAEFVISNGTVITQTIEAPVYTTEKNTLTNSIGLILLLIGLFLIFIAIFDFVAKPQDY